MILENTSNNQQIGFYARKFGIGLLTTLTTVASVSSALENLDPSMPENAYVRPETVASVSSALENLDPSMPENAYVRPESDFKLVQERLDLINPSNSEDHKTYFVDSMISEFDILYQYENHKTYFVDSMISEFDILYQYENPSVDDIQYTKDFIINFASYIDTGIHHLDTAVIKIDEDNYISIKWERSGQSLYVEIKDKRVYFTKLWFQDNQLISSDGILTEENYRETWEWIINGN